MVELRAPKLEGVKDLGRRLESNGLRAWSINSLEGAGERDLREQARVQAWQGAECGAPYVVCVPGRRREGLEEAVAALAEICHQEGAALAFEYMGFEWSAVRTLAEALAVHPGHVVVDTFHWMLGDGSLVALRACDPARIAVVHVSDAPTTDLARLGDADRVLPGEGVLQLDGFYRTLGEMGYDGVLSVELFPSPENQEGRVGVRGRESPGTVSAPRAYAAMKRLATALLPAGDDYV